MKYTALFLVLGFCLCFADEISEKYVIYPDEFTKMEEVYEIMARRREARLSKRLDLSLSGVAFLRETSVVGSLIIGIIDFYQTYNSTTTYVDAFVYAQGSYLVPNTYYGMHVHTYGDLSQQDGDAVGAHFTGQGSPVHGCPPNPIRHEGDMGNFLVTDTGIISEWKTLDLLQTFNVPGNYVPSSIIGRAVVLHGIQDNCDASYLGPKIAIGTIGIGYESPSTVGSDIEPEALVAHVTGTSYCFQCQASVWVWKALDTSTNTVVIRVRARAYSPYIEGQGWNRSAHGWAINQWGDISTKNGQNIGGHYDSNLDLHFHGYPSSPNHHTGDLGNSLYVIPYNGGPYIQTWLDVILDGNEFTFQEAAGRGISYYNSYDRGADCQSLGGAGSVWGMGVLGVANPSISIPRVPKSAVVVLPDTFENIECLSNNFNDAPPPDSSSASNVLMSLAVVMMAVVAYIF